MDTSDSCRQIWTLKTYKGDIFITREPVRSPYPSQRLYKYCLYIPVKEHLMTGSQKDDYFIHEVNTSLAIMTDVANFFLKRLKLLISYKKCPNIIELTTEEWDFLFNYGYLEEPCDDHDISLEPEVYNAFIDPANPEKVIFGTCQYI